ncbi:SDR family oxidoreductase [Parvibaculum sp.]|jgi:NAD(P)-dependent dehydrogenase (short-subunit alcohol dehydrogenase family)|uniref:SDR family NAD(P)-dependent oxidoreductase n=1 Tax=Parvibaculum sp. TaxID=2024848 RepID=UPI000C3AC717|nr:SDR family oxidoreductase [Parvibaculum sp.]MAM95467.1 2-deoxy-D-gluconate 3-dehydrogenase [Parvibaculum sp.]|tara:strand:+ start:5319 stop:6101 length:783 start_codon:yes stop_codon:yes gene_type:complete
MSYKPFDLSGKVALVTGGNGGIGLGMADAIAQSGADVAIWGTNEDKNKKAADQLRAHGVKVYSRKVDVSDESQVIDGIGETVKELGRIDAVFANAGVGFGAPSFIEMSTDVYRKTLAVNLDGVFWTLRESARHMVERAKNGDAGGSLVGIASLAAIEGAARNEAYAATKGGVISMIKSVAVEHARYGMRANAILPGWIATDMTAQAQAAPAFAEKVIPRVPARRWGEPGDFGGVAVYLTSDASSYHSGDTFVIDGGYAIF